ncbi:MAG: tyrosine-type recombinase/integrase [Ketobacter sp.]|nr:tyrosine-type recombinase/integrase [Ketobacter sp.]
MGTSEISFGAKKGVEALAAYLAGRGPTATDHVFIYRHKPLSSSYCRSRLRTYGQRCGLHITPHQLRFSCATLLLNAGTPILTVQRILGHQNVERVKFVVSDHRSIFIHRLSHRAETIAE